MREVRDGEQRLRGRVRQAAKHAGWGCRGAQAGEAAGDGPGVAEGAENAVDPRRADRRKELRKIECGNDRFAGVDLRTGEAGAAGGEAVGSVVKRNSVQNFVKNAALDGFEARFRRFEQSRAAAFGDGAVAVMLERCFVGTAMGAAFVSQPPKLDGAFAQPVRKVDRCRQGRDL